jgi:beta-N-acetylhexosaminidase
MAAKTTSPPSSFAYTNTVRFALTTRPFSLFIALATLVSTLAAPAAARAQGASPDEQRVDALLSRMTLEQKVGQLFLVFFNGQDLSPSLLRSIKDYNVGGVVFFQSNIVSAGQTAALINAAQREAVASGAGVPLFVSLDQEGGLITRMPPPAVAFPSQMALGASADIKLAQRMAQAHADQLRALGFNMNLAPVLDVNDNANNPIIGTRAFAGRPNIVGQLGVEMIKVYRANNIIAVPKHFPGHGSAVIDSHNGLPVINKSLSAIEATELAPFKLAFANAQPDALMTAHIVLPALDNSGLPATLSSKVLQDVLRKQLGYKGLIVSDSMTMDAIDERYSVDKALVMAFRAGVDVLALGADVGAIPIANRRDYQTLLRAIKSEVVLQKRLDESVRRILLTKAAYKLLDWKPVDEKAAESALAAPEQLDIAREVALGSVTVVRDPNSLLPLKPQRKVLLVAPKERDRIGFYAADALSAAFKACLPNLTVQLVELRPTAADIRRAVEQAGKHEHVIVATLNARFYPEQARLVRALQQPIVLGLRNPYDALVIQDSAAFLTDYSDVPVSLEALASVVCGRSVARGVMPVDLVLPTPTPRPPATRTPVPQATPVVTSSATLSTTAGPDAPLEPQPAATPTATPVVSSATVRRVARRTPTVARRPIVARKPVATRRPVAVVRQPARVGGLPPLPPPPP